MADWNPTLYHQFRAERAAPVHDLLALLTPRPGMRIVDLGCGTGEWTKLLAEKLEATEVVGIDSSPAMLAEAAVYAGDRVRFELGSLEKLAGSWDLIFTNAALQWVPDHATLIPHLMNCLAPGGTFLCQIPTNHTHPSQRCMVAVAAEEPYASALGGYEKSWDHLLDLHGYAQLLWECGGKDLIVLEKIYPHEVVDAVAMVRFIESTAMRPYLERLPAELHDPFIQRITDQLRDLFPGSPVLFGFRRLLMHARREDPPAPTTWGRSTSFMI